ncbi:MAG: DUF4314 domain-containing protein [Methanobacterium sp.]
MFEKSFSPLDKKILNTLRDEFPSGTRVKCVEMIDEPAPSGTEGTVILVDDLGTVHVNWDNGHTLGLLYDEDKYEKI